VPSWIGSACTPARPGRRPDHRLFSGTPTARAGRPWDGDRARAGYRRSQLLSARLELVGRRRWRRVQVGVGLAGAGSGVDVLLHPDHHDGTGELGALGLGVLAGAALALRPATERHRLHRPQYTGEVRTSADARPACLLLFPLLLLLPLLLGGLSHRLLFRFAVG